MPAGQVAPTIPVYGAQITTVDPTQGIVQGVMKADNQVRGISVFTTPIAFRWPVPGEAWLVKQINGTWYLDSPWPATDSTTSFGDINPGDVILNTPTGVVHIIGSSTTPPLDYSLTPPTAWAGLPYAATWGNCGTPWQVGQYSLNPLGECLIRGVAAKSTAWAIGNTIATLPATFRPLGQEMFTCTAQDSSGQSLGADIVVQTNGAIVLYNVVSTVVTPGTMTFLSLSGIRYSTS